MELYKLPHILRAVADSDSRIAYAKRFAKLAERDTYKAGMIIQSFATAMNSLTGKLGALPEGALLNEEQQKITSLRDKIYSLASACIYETNNTTLKRFPQTVFRVKIDRALGTMRNLGRLRSVCDTLNNGEDYTTSIEWLRDNFDLVYCPQCDQLEYTVKTKTAYDENFHEVEICRVCAESDFRWSDYYEKYVHYDYHREARDVDNSWVLIHSEDDNFVYSDDHDFYHHIDWQEPEPPVIGRYHNSKPHQRVIIDDWSKLKHRWFGVELEVEIKDHQVDRESKAKLLHELINDGEYGKRVFFEYDGSLTNGFEIVTQPMSLPGHHDMWQWLNNRDATRHLLSHNTRTCGLHVHVNKDNLTQIQIAKIVTFVNDPRNEDMIKAIARRYAEGYCKIKQKDLDTAHVSSDRYEAVNLTNRNTIEFRIFKGSLKYESVIAAIEFSHALCDFCSLPSTNDVASLTGDNFIDFINNDGAAETSILRPYMNAVLQTA